MLAQCAVPCPSAPAVARWKAAPAEGAFVAALPQTHCRTICQQLSGFVAPLCSLVAWARQQGHVALYIPSAFSLVQSELVPGVAVLLRSL